MRNVRELRGVGAGRKIDTDAILAALAGVIDTEALAHLAGLDPDGSVFAGVVSGSPAKDIDSDGAFLESVATAGQRVFHYVLEELLATPAGSELVAVKDAL